MTYKQIGEKMCLTPGTIDGSNLHLRTISIKYGDRDQYTGAITMLLEKRVSRIGGTPLLYEAAAPAPVLLSRSNKTLLNLSSTWS